MSNGNQSAVARGRALYVFDDEAKDDFAWSTGQDVVVCPMTTDYGRIGAVVEMIRNQSKAEVEVVNYAELFNAKAFATRASFTRFMADFAAKPICAGLSLKRYMAAKGGRFSFWWLTPIAEKNTVATPAFDWLAALLTIIELARSRGCAEIRADIADGPLARGLEANGRQLGLIVTVKAAKGPSPAGRQARSLMKAAVQAVKLASKSISARWVMRGAAGVKAAADAKFLLLTPFPLFDKEAWARGTFKNNYFGPFQVELEKKYPGQSAWLAMFVRFENIRWRAGLKLGRFADNNGYPLAFVEQWLTLKDFWSIVADTLRSAAKFAGCRAELEREFAFEEAGVKVNIWPLFEADWYDSFSGRGLLLGLANYRAFRRVVWRLKPGTTIIYAAEMLAWEKALNLAAAQRSDLKVVGIQHTTVPLMLLTYSVDRAELNSPAAIDALPAPHRLACVGPVANDLLLACGWDSDRVFPWVAVRYGHFRALLERPLEWSNRRRLVVLALPAAAREARELLFFAWQALAGGDMRVAVKAHPICPAEDLAKSLGLTLAGSNFDITGVPLADLLAGAKAMVVSGSSVALDSLACGCPVIIPRLARSVDRNALTGVSDLPIYVNSPAELAKAVGSILDAESPPIRIDEARAFIKRYLNLPASDEEWLISFEEATA